ncbi:hypothetical protein ACAM_0320 [Aeropyrum camini SY1 = JCM 12091]|uniref:Uncharacterized protein n=2 Tax=Aeropyrum camini TaxID=229980 RepID=U3TEP0_9CREN|nr:hypothetical protein ACAM_0320 [Aeropyrum camini SY1 = JCM 12091]
MHEEIVERALYRIVEDLAEALDRTPPTVSSRALVEGALKLALGAYNSARALREECRRGRRGGYGRVEA